MTETTRQGRAAELIRLLEKQAQLYDRLNRLSEAQSRLVAKADAEPLLTILSQRQELIDQLVVVSGEVEPYKQQWAEIYSSLDEPDRERLRALIDRVRSQLDQIISQDEKDRQALTDRRRSASQELQQVRHGSSVGRAYSRAVPNEPRYTDRQG